MSSVSSARKYGRGDDGKTFLLSGEKIWKDDERLEALGEIDELSSIIGVAISLLGEEDEVSQILLKTQEHLFIIGSQLAQEQSSEAISYKIDEALNYIDNLVYELESKLPILRRFIFLGGAIPAAVIHLARAVARRSERRVVTMSKKYLVYPGVLAYMNRLSTLLFILARYVNMKRGYKE
ncbi:MAG: cob(I)yrinic acid a,c-diamide adenosyltransferase, partial [Aigarchaeota archaeon]|nr:cob(I)yrinic acid a,c-diamide adenosyltransferase [Aigarchaeota archaeon]